MSDFSHPPGDAGNSTAAARPPGRRWWQVGLRTLLLLTAALAVWMAFFINRRQNAVLEARIGAMVPLAHELIVGDEKKIAVVKLEEYWYDENRWDLYLPRGRYRLCLATRDLTDAGLPPALRSVPIAAGLHHLALEQWQDQDAWRITVTGDGAEKLSVVEPKEWNPGRGSTGGGQYPVSEQLPPDKPAVLFRRRFMREDCKGRMTTPSGPSEGILLWIEPMSGPDAKP